MENSKGTDLDVKFQFATKADMAKPPLNMSPPLRCKNMALFLFLWINLFKFNLRVDLYDFKASMGCPSRMEIEQCVKEAESDPENKIRRLIFTKIIHRPNHVPLPLDSLRCICCRRKSRYKDEFTYYVETVVEGKTRTIFDLTIYL